MKTRCDQNIRVYIQLPQLTLHCGGRQLSLLVITGFHDLY